MSPTMKGGLLIGILCSLWILIMGLTGWYKDPVLLNMFWVVVVIQVGVLFWGLKQKAATGATYGQLVGAGTLMSVIGGVLLFCFSLFFTTVLFPSYFDEIRAMNEQILRSKGLSDEALAAALQADAVMSTPFVNALSGFLGTVVTGLIISLILAAVTKKK